MALDRMLGFSLKPVRIDPDGASTPPDISALAPPSHPAAPPPARLFEKTRIEGLTAPPAPAPALAEPARPDRVPEPLPKELPQSTTEDVAPRSAKLGEPAPPIAQQAPNAAAKRGVRGFFTWRDPRVWIALAAFSAVIGFGSAMLWSRALRQAASERDLRAELASTREGALAWQAAQGLSATACARQREPKRIVSDVSAALGVEARTVTDHVDVLLGVAAPGNAALGLSLNATTLEATEIVRDTSARELLGIVPDSNAPPYHFAVDRAGVGGYRDFRTLPWQGELALARTNVGVQLVRKGDRRSISLWPLHEGEEISRPRVEWLDPERLAVVLRKGGRSGTLAIGWLDLQSVQRSALRDLPMPSGEIGLPSLAVQNGRAAIAAAVRATPAHPWRIQIAVSEWSGAPTRMPLPELVANPDLDTFAPSLAPLGDSRWILQWTEGREGERRVRAMTLNSEFHAIGSPINVSLKETSAGGGIITPVDQGLISLYLVQKPNAYDLWATTLACN